MTLAQPTQQDITAAESLQALPPGLQELTGLCQWVCWCYELDAQGKPTKVPYNPRTGKMASTTNKYTWASYEEARKAKRSRCTSDGRPYDGIGFVFSDDYTGIDLDHCIDPGTGKPYQWAQKIIDLIASYSELSPSETGVHIIARGKLSGKGRKHNGVEMYSRARFFTITGNHLLGTPDTIEERQEQIDALYASFPPPPAKKPRATPKPSPYDSLAFDDAAILKAAHLAKNGAKFARLWRGDASDYRRKDGSPDESRADQALCNILAFWTGNDAGRIDRLYRQSGLYREKWNRDDYREATIAHAIDITTDTYHPRTGELDEEDMHCQLDNAAPPADLTAALALIAELKQENAALKQELRFYRKVDAIPAKKESVSQKETYKGIYRSLLNREPDTEDGYYQLEPWRIGIEKGQSTQTVRDNITYYTDAIPALQKKLVKVDDEFAPQGYRQETYVKPTDLFYHPEKHQFDVSRNQGGKQVFCICPHCKSTRTKHTSVYQVKCLEAACGKTSVLDPRNKKHKAFIIDDETEQSYEEKYGEFREPVQSQVDSADPEPEEHEGDLSTPCTVNLSGYITHTPLPGQVDNADERREMQGQDDNAANHSQALPAPVCVVCGTMMDGFYGGRWLCALHYDEARRPASPRAVPLWAEEVGG